MIYQVVCLDLLKLLEIAEGQDRGEALFLQAWFVYYLNDLFGQVPFREI